MGKAGGETLNAKGQGWTGNSLCFVDLCLWEPCKERERAQPLERDAGGSRGVWRLPKLSSSAPLCSHIPPLRDTGSSAGKMGEMPLFGHPSLSYAVIFLGWVTDAAGWCLKPEKHLQVAACNALFLLIAAQLLNEKSNFILHQISSF